MAKRFSWLCDSHPTITFSVKWAIPEKIQTEPCLGLRIYRVEDFFFLETPLEFFIFYFIPRNSRQNRAQPLNIPQNCFRGLQQLSFVPFNSQLAARGAEVEVVVRIERDEIYLNNFLHTDKNYF